MSDVAGTPETAVGSRPLPVAFIDVAAGVVAASVIPTTTSLFAGASATWLIAAVCVPALVALATRLAPRPARWPALWADRPFTRVACEVAALIVVLALLPAGLHHESALTHLQNGGAQLVTSSLPMATGGPALGLVVVVFAAATIVAIELARRAESTLLPLVPAVVIFAGALLLTSGHVAVRTYAPVVFVISAGVFVLLRNNQFWWTQAETNRGPNVLGRRQRRRSRVGPGRLLLGAACLGAMAGVIWPAGTNLPGAHVRPPYDLRAAFSPAPQPSDNTNLLSRYPSIHDGPERPQFDAAVTGTNPADLHWRLATYDQFRGDGWTSSAVFQTAARTLPPTNQPAGPAVMARAVVKLEQTTAYLPTFGVPLYVSVAGLGVATTDNLLIVPSGMAAPSRYEIRGEVAEPSANQLLAAQAEPRQTTFDPGSPPLSPTVTSAASQIAATANPGVFSRLAAIREYLTGPPFSLHPAGNSPIGTGTYQVDQLLKSTHNGSAEQYAAAFALLARAMGYQSRLAVGYAGGQAGPGGTTVRYTTRNLTVWPEVRLAGIGWFAFPVQPSKTGEGKPAPAPDPPALQRALVEQQKVNEATHQLNQPTQKHTSPADPNSPNPTPNPVVHHSGKGPGWLVISVAAIFMCCLMALIGLLGAKARRRARQRAAREPALRVTHSWEFVLDRIEETGLAVPGWLTRDEVADRVGARFGETCSAPLAVLAPLVDAAVYDRRVQPQASAAEDAWAQAGVFQTELRRTMPLGRRIRGALSLAPWRRARSGRAADRSG